MSAGAAGVAGVAGLLYRAAPSFWRQYASEWGKEIPKAPHLPDPSLWPDTGFHAAWLGHTTVLMKLDGYTILTDPVFSDRCGIDLKLMTVGLKRLVAPALPIDKLPKIDLVLLSHAHFDHFDLPSLRALERGRPEVVTAAKTSDLLRVDRYRRVTEAGWNASTRVGPLVIHGLEVNHWGARVRTDTWRGYGGYVIESRGRRIVFAGDTADSQSFRRLPGAGPVDLALMPIGAYNPWIHAHCTPEQAMRMANEARAEHVLAVHHQTFQLSREPHLEPIERLQYAAGNAQSRVAFREIGQEFHLSL
ncbi:MAG: MBL fold metallo-hydrolase [Acidobacteria bacterium]|nr:MBL fold metallo-hydrolase [Acidobacteriota bacterium]